jgi:GT2 family glycosyltransferase
MTASAETTPRTGILVLDYHQPAATLACVRRLLEVEGADARILWLENDADATLPEVLALLGASGLSWTRVDPADGSLPEPGQVGLVAIPGNAGYAGGNNVGLRLLHRHRVPYAWVMNNDTFLARGSSADLVRAAEAEPEVGLWGMGIASGNEPMFHAWRIQERDFATNVLPDRSRVGSHPMAYISGCAMFFQTDRAAALGFIPEEYFLFYEDAAFTWEFRRAGFRIGTVAGVEIAHEGSLATGRRKPLSEFYCRRNRWRFIQRYFPERLGEQTRRFFTYQLQKRLFGLQFARLALEWQAWRDFRAGRLGPTDRRF